MSIVLTSINGYHIVVKLSFACLWITYAWIEKYTWTRNIDHRQCLFIMVLKPQMFAGNSNNGSHSMNI